MNTTVPGMAAYQPCISHKSMGASRAISATTGFSDPGGNGLKTYRPVEAATAKTNRTI